MSRFLTGLALVLLTAGSAWSAPAVSRDGSSIPRGRAVTPEEQRKFAVREAQAAAWRKGRLSPGSKLEAARQRVAELRMRPQRGMSAVDRRVWRDELNRAMRDLHRLRVEERRARRNPFGPRSHP